MAQPGALARSVEFGVKFTTGVSTSADARCLPFSAEIHLAEGNKTGFGSDECGVRAERNAGIDQLGLQRRPPGARRLQGLRVPLSIYAVELVVSVQLHTLRPSDLAAGGDGNRAGGYQNEV